MEALVLDRRYHVPPSRNVQPLSIIIWDKFSDRQIALHKSSFRTLFLASPLWLQSPLQPHHYPAPPAPIYVAGIHILDLCNRPRGYQFRKASSPFRTTRPNKRNTQSPFCLHNGGRYKRLFPALRHGNEIPSKELHGTSRRNFLKKPLPAAGSRRNFFGNL